MTPYYQDSHVTIYHGDCREILPSIEQVDLVLTDPPYNSKSIGPNKQVYEGTTIMQLSNEEYADFCREWFGLVEGVDLVFTPGIANICNYPQPYWILCWHKPAAVSFNRMRGYNAWEPISVYGRPFKRLPQDYLYFNTMNLAKGPESKHPCPKPVALWAYLVSLSHAKVVLDPFLGSGTTCYCAKKLGRKCIGIEIEERYCEIAANRCRQMVMEF